MVLKNISFNIQEMLRRKSAATHRGCVRITPALIGKVSEAIAVKALKHAGHTLIERNWRCRQGEIDIITSVGDTLVIIEVKARRRDSPFDARSSVSDYKLSQLYKVSKIYLHASTGRLRHNHVRFDVIQIAYHIHDRCIFSATIDHIENVLPHGIPNIRPKKDFIRW